MRFTLMLAVCALCIVLLSALVSADSHIPYSTVTVSSSYADYSSDVIDDGIIDAYGGTATTWASLDNGGPHWVEFDFGESVSLSEFTMYWGYNSAFSVFMTSQEFLVQAWDGSWQTVGMFTRSVDEVASTLAFTPQTAQRWRVFQPANRGPELYDQVIWVTEINYAIEEENALLGDVNDDGFVDVDDLLLIFANFRRSTFEARADVNADGVVNVFDLVLVARDFGRGADEQLPVDTTPPSASILAPLAGQVLSSGTASTPLSVSTTEAATCRWSASNQAYASMPSSNTLSGANSMSHSATFTGLSDGNSYTRYVRCIDAFNNAMSSSEHVNFSVAASDPPSVLWPNEPAGYSVVQESSWESAQLGSWTSGTRDGWGLKFLDATRSVAIESIPDGILGESRALTYIYPPNHESGGGVESYLNIPAGQTQCYVGVYARLTENWYGHASSITKVFYIQGSTTSDSWNAMWYQANGGATNPLVPSIVDQLEGGTHRRVDGVTGSLVRGEWHLLEGILELPSGRARYYVDGELQIDSTAGGPETVVDVTLSGILGGLGTMSNPQEQRMQFDRVRVSCQDASSPPDSDIVLRGNEPSGMTTRVDYAFDNPIPSGVTDSSFNDGSGLGIIGNNDGTVTQMTRGGSPQSPSGQMQRAYVPGLSGTGVGDVYGFLGSANAVYMAAWVQYEDDFEWNRISQKFAFFWDSTGNYVLLQTYNGAHLSLIRNAIPYDPNQGIIPSLGDGEWHYVEYLVDRESNGGEAWVWFDGVLVSNHLIPMPYPFAEFKYDSTWGGGGDKQTTSYQWTDHLYVSTR